MKHIASQNPELSVVAPEIELGESGLTPDQVALVAKNFGLVRYAARRAIGNGWWDKQEFEEIVADGYVGLVSGAAYFNTAKVSADAETSSNYFMKSIMGEIQKGMRSRYGRIYTEVDPETGETRKVDKIAKVAPSVVYASARSLDEPIRGEAASTDPDALGDRIEDRTSRHSVETMHQLQILSSVVNGAPLQHREIMVLRVGLERTHAEIAAAVGLTEMQVRSIIRHLTKKIQTAAESPAKAA